VARPEFDVETENFADLEINKTPVENFHYFFHKKRNTLIQSFVLLEKPRVKHVCTVALVSKDGRFSPRLRLSIRDKSGKLTEKRLAMRENMLDVKSSVSLDDCHSNFWKLITYLKSLREIDLPADSFSLVTEPEAEIVEALRERAPESVVNIIKQLSAIDGVTLSQADVTSLLKKKEKLGTFEKMCGQTLNEAVWQDFFETNKWIFGYGLDYQILRQEQTQPNYGGTAVDGKGGQQGDFLTSTLGDLSFTVLVEIKTPRTKLLRGTTEIRAGAWSLAGELTDALSQIEANVAMWEQHGASLPANAERLAKSEIFTVHPKGILVLGSLTELDSRAKRETFQRFRRSIHGIEIMTFDELLRRARFIVEHTT
jgi:hypothetical protein